MRFLPIIIANDYTKAAFNFLKSKGYIVTTPKQLFGHVVGAALSQLLDTLIDAGKIVASDPNKLAELFLTLSSIEGAAANLRGALFEYIIGHLVKQKEGGSIEIGKETRDPISKMTREIDVRRYKKENYCHIYECKGCLSTKTIDVSEVKKWLDEKVHVIFSAYQALPSYTSAKFEFSFWTTGQLDADSIALLTKANNLQDDYTISWKHGNEVREYAKDAEMKSLRQTLDDHYYKDPMNFHKARRKRKTP